MKKILASAVLAISAISAGAQDMYFAELLSKNNYYGTARSMALGNAMTALGGDPGSYVLNPAGSAVSSYGQFTITPGLVISSAKSLYCPDGLSGQTYTRDTRTRLYFPNTSFSIVMDTGRDFGLKRLVFGFQVTGTAHYNRLLSGNGTNSTNSFLGSVAAASYGCDPESLAGYRYASYWANQIGQYGKSGNFAGSNQVISADESYCYVPGTLNQYASYSTNGSKQDILFNLGFDMNDVFFFGFNLGFPNLRYTRYENFVESSVDPSQFPVNFNEQYQTTTTTCYLNSSNQFSYNASASGIYFKAGVIWLPVDGLRVGAGLRSPTLLTVNENWQYTADCSFQTSRFDSRAYTTPGEYSYAIRTPWSANAGVAYTFFGKALLSFDYELEDFSSMRYLSRGSAVSAGNWYGVNETNRLFCGLAHNLRVGAELKLTQEFAIRAGYNFATCPERYYDGSDGSVVTAETYLDSNGNPLPIVLSNPRYFKADARTASFGFGYSSPGSFYADIAARYSSNPIVTFVPYYNTDYIPLDKNGRTLDVDLPLMKSEHKVWDVVLTLGWRF